MNAIVLIGCRGAGKTTVGRELARRKGLPFVDLDDMIEQKAGRTISDLVEQGGWPLFRRHEREALLDIRWGTDCVVATGGGIVEDPGNREHLKALGRVIWLRATTDAIAARLSGDARTSSARPSLTGKGTIDEIASVFETREPLYRETADYVLDTSDGGIGEIVERVLVLVEGEADRSCQEIP